MQSPFTCILLVVSLSYTSFVTCETLIFTECAAKYPSVTAGSSIVYDGFDTIYIMAGYGEDSPKSEVFKYSISADHIEKISDIPQRHYAGCGFRSGNGSLVYASGFQSNDVYTTATANGPWSLLSTLPPNVAGYSGCIKHDPWSATLFGGWFSNQTIVELDLRTGSSIVSGTLSEECIIGFAVWNPLTQNATIFCSVASYWGGIILGYHKPSGLSSRILQYPRSFHHSSVSFDGVNAYVIGGWYSEEMTGWESDILMFNTLTHEVRLVSVENIPSTNNTIFDLAGTVYVPYLNRIYIFSGRRGLFEYLDTIWYMDLDPVNPIQPLPPPQPDIFNCQDKTPGLYPHPSDCSMFIICKDNNTFVQTCPSPHLYDTTIQSCNLPESVNCGLSCEGKPSGVYPHPHDCSLYISCNDDDEMIIRKCPPPFLFDPILTTCNDPEVVDCGVNKGIITPTLYI